MKSRFLGTLVLLVCYASVAYGSTADYLGLVPAPRNIELYEGVFVFDSSVSVVADGSVSYYVYNYLPRGVFSHGGKVDILVDEALDLPSEGYELTITAEEVVVRGVDRAGMLNGFHTLLQLFPSEVYAGDYRGTCTLPAMKIVDWPEYSYRAMHFDIARTFADKAQLKEYIGHLAHHKINNLHLHLTDDEGWRIEILAYPELTEIGAWRGGDSPIWPIYGAFDEKYGGYLTQQELREIVAFAEERGITIVPEIDLPGHSLAIGKVHPEVLCPTHRNTDSTAGYDKCNVWCVAREENYQMLDDILREVCDIFPSEYIHIGGDEVTKSYWKSCPDCNALMRAEGYTSYEQLQEHFMNRVSEILAKYGRKPAMWNEATNSGTLSREVRIHGWEGLEECRKVAEAGFPTVVMPGPYFYFDMRQSDDEPGHNWAGVVTTEKCYSVNLDKLGYSAKAKSNVIGFSGAFWSELYVTYRDEYDNYAEYQTYPRICALAEVCWLPQSQRSWSSFSSRLELHKGRMDAMGISYRKGEPAAPEGEVVKPAMRCSSSIPFHKSGGATTISNYGNSYGMRTSRTCKEGDWILYEFTSALNDVTVELTTGYRHVTRGLFITGVVETKGASGDFVEVAKLVNGGATINITEPVKAIRLRCTKTGNGDSYVYVQHPIIRKIEK